MPFESRRADEIAKLIAHHGGTPVAAPSMREVPLDENPAARDWARRLLAGGIDVQIWLTGVGTRTLLARVATEFDPAAIVAALARTVSVARGPKPVAALREWGLAPTVRVPEPNTWRDLLATIDGGVPVSNQNVGLQEYGITNHSLIAGLEALKQLERIDTLLADFLPLYPRNTQPLFTATTAGMIPATAPTWTRTCSSPGWQSAQK